MKLKYYNIITKSNKKRNSKNITVCILVTLATFLLVVSGVYLSTFGDYVTTQMETPEFTSCDIYPNIDGLYNTSLTEDVLEDIENVPHVTALYKETGVDGGGEVESIIYADGTSYKPEEGKEISELQVDQAYPDQKVPIIAGKTLEESPVYSCLVPNYFSLNSEDWDNNIFLNGEDFIGSTITMNCNNFFRSIVVKDDGVYPVAVPEVEVVFKVVGVYALNANTYGEPVNLRITNDTALQIEKDALSTLSPDDEMLSDLSYDKSSELYGYILTVDSLDNVDAVVQEVQAMGVDITYPRYATYAGIRLTIFTSISLVLMLTVSILGIVNIFLSVSNNLLSRKKEIGLYKAIGYTNRNIGISMYFEQFKVAIKGFVIGETISIVLIIIFNYLNSNGEFGGRYLIIQPEQLIGVTIFALAFAIIIPLICVLIMMKKLNKIEPKDAMGE